MQPFPQGHGRSLRVASVVLALLVLLAVVAFASRTGFGHASNTTPTPGYVTWATSVVLVLAGSMQGAPTVIRRPSSGRSCGAHSASSRRV